jgi:hypothetical protein
MSVWLFVFIFRALRQMNFANGPIVAHNVQLEFRSFTITAPRNRHMI